MVGPDDVCVLIPTLNEAATIGAVIEEFHEHGYEHILVVDGNSADQTPVIAEAQGAEVITQTGSGKGRAVQQGIAAVERPYILLVDGDGTYRAADADRLVGALDDGAHHVIGNRFANLRPGAMTRLNRIGNRIINRVFLFIHHRDLKDILSGYRALSVESTEQMRFSSAGFGIETEMAVESVRQNLPISVVDITYRPRPQQSSTNLRPIRDGGVIILTLYRLAKTTNPLFYFGTLGGLSIFTSLLIGGFVAFEWLVRDIAHQVLAMVAVFGVLFGFQLLTFGVLSDLITRLYNRR